MNNTEKIKFYESVIKSMERSFNLKIVGVDNQDWILPQQTYEGFDCLGRTMLFVGLRDGMGIYKLIPLTKNEKTFGELLYVKEVKIKKVD